MSFDFSSILGGFQDFIQSLLGWISELISGVLGNLPFLQ